MTTRIPEINREKKILRWSNIFLLLFFIPFFIIGKNSYVPMGDNYESTIAWIKILMNEGAFWKQPSYIVDQVMNGLPRVLYTQQLYLPAVIIAYAGSFWGYIIDLMLMTFTAFWGMYLLIRTNFSEKFHNDYFLIAFIAVLFALLPFWSFDLSVSGQPLLFYAFFNLRKKQNTRISYFIIFLFPFFTSLVFVGVFDCIILAFILLRDTIRYKRINNHFFWGLALLSVMYLVSSYQLIYFTLSGHYTSHRVEMLKGLTRSFTSMVENFMDITVNLQWHSPGLQKYLVLPVVIVTFLLFLFKGRQAKQFGLFKYLVGFIFLCNLFYALYYSHYFKTFFNSLFKIFPMQLQRFHCLEPFVWYLAFGLCIAYIAYNFKWGRYIAISLCLLQLTIISFNNPGFKNVVGHFFLKNATTYNRMTNEAIFSDIALFLGKPKNEYRVASVGLYPSIAQWNGFYTLDGYMADYPLEYKHQFREIIATELEKGNYKTYFDKWGSKCYLYINDVKDNLSDYAKGRPYFGKGIENPALNFDKFLQMGGRYIFSSIPITSSRMILLKKFERAEAWYDIYVYEVK